MNKYRIPLDEAQQRLKDVSARNQERRRRVVETDPDSGPAGCSTCGFDLWLRIGSLEVSSLGLYNDSRFPGRCLLSLNEHFDHLDNVPTDLRHAFMDDIALASLSIRLATGSPRINVSILGNAESHVHAHLIPRYPETERHPNQAPWADPRPKEKLPDSEVQRLRSWIGQLISNATRGGNQ